MITFHVVPRRNGVCQHETVSIGFAAIAGPPCLWIVYHTYKLLKSQSGTLKGCGAPGSTMVLPPVCKLDPKNLEAHAGTQCYPVPPSIRKINSKGTAVLNARGAGSRLLRFWVKVPNTSSEIGTTLSRDHACGRMQTGLAIEFIKDIRVDEAQIGNDELCIQQVIDHLRVPVGDRGQRV
jgi:hypothetical protein